MDQGQSSWFDRDTCQDCHLHESLHSQVCCLDFLNLQPLASIVLPAPSIEPPSHWRAADVLTSIVPQLCVVLPPGRAVHSVAPPPNGPRSPRFVPFD